MAANQKIDKDTLRGIRSEIHSLADQINYLAINLQNADIPLLETDIEKLLRQTRLPYAIDEYIRQELAKAFADQGTYFSD